MNGRHIPAEDRERSAGERPITSRPSEPVGNRAPGECAHVPFYGYVVSWQDEKAASTNRWETKDYVIPALRTTLRCQAITTTTR